MTLRILTYTTLFPNPQEPLHGIFVAERWRHLIASGQVENQVMAPVPWFPSTHPAFGRYARKAAVPSQETRESIPIHHPRYPVIPKIGMTLAPLLLALATLGAMKRLQAHFPFDLIDAHYLYPDGIAAILLGQWLGKPVTLTARGTDINLIPRHTLPRLMLRHAMRRADGLIAVSSALADAMSAVGGFPRERVHVLRNGVDLGRFRPLDRQACRESLGLTGPVLLSVGHLIERKGHHLILEALPDLPGVTLLIAGEGEMRGALERLARQLGVADRVRLLGAVPQERLPLYYSAADLLVLASSREGWANVLLEALACGTPVAATAVWGAPELVTSPVAGALIPERTPRAIGRVVLEVLGSLPERGETRCFAEGFSWDGVTEGQLRLFREVVERYREG